jgi:hypothetical protein
MKKHIKGIVLYFIIYFWIYSLSSCSALRADELNCETFVNEKICQMTPQEQEKWFWELLKSLIEDEKQEPVEILEA